MAHDVGTHTEAAHPDERDLRFWPVFRRNVGLYLLNGFALLTGVLIVGTIAGQLDDVEVLFEFPVGYVYFYGGIFVLLALPVVMLGTVLAQQICRVAPQKNIRLVMMAMATIGCAIWFAQDPNALILVGLACSLSFLWYVELEYQR